MSSNDVCINFLWSLQVILQSSYYHITFTNKETEAQLTVPGHSASRLQELKLDIAQVCLTPMPMLLTAPFHMMLCAFIQEK